MNKKKKKKVVIISSCSILVLLLTLSLILNRKTGNIENVLKDGVMLVNKVVMFPFTTLNKEKGKKQTESYLIQKNVNASLEKEIQELKETLELNNRIYSY